MTPAMSATRLTAGPSRIVSGCMSLRARSRIARPVESQNVSPRRSRTSGVPGRGRVQRVVERRSAADVELAGRDEPRGIAAELANHVEACLDRGHGAHAHGLGVDGLSQGHAPMTPRARTRHAIN